MKWLALAVGAFLFSAASADAATLYIEEYASGVSQAGTTQAQIPPAPALADQTVSLSGSSAQSAAFNAKTHAVSLICDEGCSISIGSNPTAATTNFLLQQGMQVRFGVSPGQVIAAIANPAGNGGGGGGVSNPLTLTRLLTITQSQANEGILASTGYSLTGANAQNMVDLAGTWNTSGNPTAIKLNITATAFGATSKLLDIQQSGVSVFSVVPNVTTRGAIRMTNGVDTLEFGPTNQFFTAIQASADIYILPGATSSSGLSIGSPGTGVTPGSGNPDGAGYSRRGIYFGRHAGLISLGPAVLADVGIKSDGQLNDDVVFNTYIIGNAATPAGVTNIVGGRVDITGGSGASGSAAAANGGSVNLIGGPAFGTGVIGAINLKSPTIQFGVASSITGALQLANAASANLTTIQAGNAAAARTYTWPTNFGAAGSVLTDAAGNGTLSWAAGGGGATLGANTFTDTQTITQATANHGILASTGYSLTGSSAVSMVDLAGTINTTGSPDVFALRITDTARGASTKLLNLYAGATGVQSEFNADRFGSIVMGGGNAAGGDSGFGAFVTVINVGAADLVFAQSSTAQVRISNGLFTVHDLGLIGWSSGAATTSIDTILTRRAAANIRQGAADAAAPVAQTLSVQSVVAGNANTAGVDWNFVGSLSNGSGAAGKIKFGLSQISAASGSQNASTVVLSLNTITASGIQFPTYGAGALSTDASGNITATSDERLKNVVRHFDAGLAELEKIQPIVYRWKPSSGMETEHEYAGLGAGNVRDTIPEAVGQTRDGYLTLSDRAIIAAEINAIKELAGELSAVKAEQGRLEQHLWYMEMKR